jgi:hypothetical protein
MNKNFTLPLFLMFFFYTTTLKSQVIFSENFDNPSTFPTGWTLADVDKKTPYESGFVTDAWTKLELVAGNFAALSTSWYNPSGQANDWMWTPAITLTGTTQKRLSWDAMALDPDYPDGYEVRIMTVAPTGSYGNIGNMLTASTQYFKITAENADWVHRVIDLTSLNGQTIYIGFRNNSNDQYYLAIDNIIVDVPKDYDASIIKPVNSTGDYSIKPLSQTSSILLEATVMNTGAKNLTNVKLNATIFNGVGLPIHTASSGTTAVLTPNSQKLFTIPAWVPVVSGDYTVTYSFSSTETDGSPIVQGVSTKFILSDSVFARDNGNIVNSIGLGIVGGTEPNAYMGHSFNIESEVYATSITVSYAVGYTGKKYASVIWSTDNFGTPNKIIASTDTLYYPSNNDLLATSPIHGGKFLLTPGTYVVTPVEFDSMIVIDQTEKIFTGGTSWAYVGAALGGVNEWILLENEIAFTNPFYIRLNVKTSGQLPVRLISFTGKNTKAGNELEWKVGEQSGIKEYVIERGDDAKNFISIGSVKANLLSSSTYYYTDANLTVSENYYRLKIVDLDSYKYSDIVRINNSNSNTTISISPNPAKSIVTLKSNNSQLLNTNAVLTNMEGKVLQQIKITQLPFKINISNLSKGMYLLQLQDKSVHKIIKD